MISTPSEKLTRNADITFDQQQRRTSWFIVGLSTLLAAAVTWVLSRGMLAPVKRLVEGTHRLAAGILAPELPSVAAMNWATWHKILIS